MKSKSSHRLEIGLLICILGTQFSRILIEWFKITFELTNLIYILGILLLIDYTIFSIFSNGIITFYSAMIWILLFQGIVVFEALLYKRTADNNFVFTLFVLAMIFGLSTQNEPQIDEDFFIGIGWLLTGIGSVLLAIVISQNNRGSLLDSRFMRLPMGGDRLTLSVIAFANLIFMLLYKSKIPLLRMIKIFFAIVDIYDILSCNRRGLMVSYLIIVAAYMIKTNRGGITKKKILGSCVAVCGLVLFVIWIMKSNNNIALFLRRYIEDRKSVV